MPAPGISRAAPPAVGTPVRDDHAVILTPEAMKFIAALSKQFTPRVQELLAAREARQARIDAGEMPDFLPETGEIRAAAWKIAPLPTELRDRRVEIIGPTERKTIISALNSGARAFVADCEDSLSPKWDNLIQGQINLRDPVRREIEFVADSGKVSRLNHKTAVLMVRPRGWHLGERHLSSNGKPIPAALVDFGFYVFHNAHALVQRGSRPYLYLPKLESHLEARLWAEVFDFAEQRLGLPRGTIRVTVLIENILAAFEMDEILYELRDYALGLNCSRSGYLFSFIQKFSKRSDYVLPERPHAAVNLRAFSLLCIQTCHRRGASAIGGMTAQVPIKDDPIANEQAMSTVRADKEREASDGHDGTWVAHPGLVSIARTVFDRLMQGPNQIFRLPKDVQVRAADLLAPPEGEITEAGLRENVSVSVQYIAAWLSGNGCVPINNFLEDAARAEIARAQIWQWIRHAGGTLNDGRRVTAELFRSLLNEERARLKSSLGADAYTQGHFDAAAALLDHMATAPDFVPFLTVPAYRKLQ